jgi:selT/selW/selH-like putative selenoprotein
MNAQQQARPQSAQVQSMASRQMSAVSMASTAALVQAPSSLAAAPHSFDLSRGVPYFEIEHCVNCHRHQWCTRHNEGRYHQYHAEFEAAIRSAFGDGIEVKKNEPPPGFVIVPDSDALTELCVNAKGETIVFPALGSFEVFMCGVQIYSKIASGRWPNADKLVERAAEKWKMVGGSDTQPAFQMSQYHAVNKDNKEIVEQMQSHKTHLALS